MEQFISTKFFFLLKNASQKGIDIDIQVLKNSYNDFAVFLFSENNAANKAAYRNKLTYVQVELVSLTETLEKKCNYLSA